MEAAIVLENVKKFYNDVPVVNDLSLSIQPGEIFGLLGPNGAGKSTTIRMLTTLTRPTAGRIAIAGYDIDRQSFQVKKQIGVVLQQVSVDTDLTVWENLEFHGRMHHIPNPQRQREIDRWLDFVDLGDRRNDLVKTLSGGMKRRLQLARALLHQPQILFLDEPTVGLDPQTRRRLWEIIKSLNQQGMTILLTTHYMEEVEYLCDSNFNSSANDATQPNRIGIMDNGRLIALGSLKDLKQEHGEGLVMRQVDDLLQGGKAGQWDYKFFPTMQAANEFFEQQPNKAGMMVRPSNLEDIFVELTGRNLD